MSGLRCVCYLYIYIYAFRWGVDINLFILNTNISIEEYNSLAFTTICTVYSHTNTELHQRICAANLSTGALLYNHHTMRCAFHYQLKIKSMLTCAHTLVLLISFLKIWKTRIVCIINCACSFHRYLELLVAKVCCYNDTEMQLLYVKNKWLLRAYGGYYSDDRDRKFR